MCAPLFTSASRVCLLETGVLDLDIISVRVCKIRKEIKTAHVRVRSALLFFVFHTYTRIFLCVRHVDLAVAVYRQRKRRGYRQYSLYRFLAKFRKRESFMFSLQTAGM